MIRTTASFVAVALAGSMAPNSSASDSANWVTALSQNVGALQDRMPRSPPASGNSVAVSSLFDSDGGTLTATAADGTKFILTVPPDATVLPLQITMTPVSGHHPSGSATAVMIEPEGAFLWQPADLKIVPPTSPDLKSLTYFRYGGPDESFTFYPGVLGSTEIEMSISYLASYGVGPDGMWAVSTQHNDRAQSARALSVRALNAASPSLSPYVARQGAAFKQMLDQEIDSDTYLNDVYAIWDDAFTNVVLPALESLGGNCDPASLTPVIQTAFELLHLDPQSDPRYEVYSQNIFAIVKDRVLNCIDVHYQLCKSQNDPTQVQLIVQLERQLQLAQLLTDAEATDIDDKITKCLHFEIDFESALTIGTTIAGESLTDHMQLRAIVPVQLEYVQIATGLKRLLRGSGEISHEFIDIEGTHCTYTPMTKPDTFVVDLLSVALFQENQNGDQVTASRSEIQISMVFFTGDPEEAFTQRCPAGSAGFLTTQFPFQPVFKSFYGYLHQDEAIPGSDGGYEIRSQPPWELVRSGNFFAKAQYVRTRTLQGLGPASEETYIFLKHTPE